MRNKLIEYLSEKEDIPKYKLLSLFKDMSEYIIDEFSRSNGTDKIDCPYIGSYILKKKQSVKYKDLHTGEYKNSEEYRSIIFKIKPKIRKNIKKS